MSQKTMIEVSDATMRFRLNNDKILSLKEFVTTALRGKLQYNDFTALEHVSFEVKKGETLGLIGRNGAGKSTMLKVISGILKPTEGSVVCRGNVVPMLELGSGFDFDLTGRENIFLNGAILGYSKEFLHEKYDEIVEFSEYIEVPFRFCCLNDNVATVMAIANDIGYEEVFRFQLRGNLEPNDILVAISGSGNSQNVLNAAKYVKAQGNKIIGLIGYSGGKLKELSDITLHVPVQSMQITEDIHMVFDHLMMSVFYKYLCGKEHFKE